jgi:hypothetical protein
MVQVSRHTGFTGSALIRLLARLTDTDVPESRRSFADRLSQWLSWTDAISLSAALNGSPSAAPPAARASGSAEEGECTRVRTVLANAIAEDGAFAADKERGPLQASTGAASMDTPADFSPYRRRYLARQQAMAASIAPLRERLRAALAARSPAMARLAAVDAVMEQVLGAREHSLLSTVPALLERHFGRLRQVDRARHGDTQLPEEPGSEIQPEAWLDVFGQDMQGVLLAELDIRFQPVEGLLEALRMS